MAWTQTELYDLYKEYCEKKGLDEEFKEEFESFLDWIFLKNLFGDMNE